MPACIKTWKLQYIYSSPPTYLESHKLRTKINLLANDTLSEGLCSVENNMPPKKTKNPVIFEPVRHPILESLDPLDAVTFIQERELYEIEIEEKDKDGKELQAASYKVSVDPQLLRSAYDMGEFDKIAPELELDDLENEHIKSFIKNLAAGEKDRKPGSTLIEATLQSLKLNCKISNPRNRILQLAFDYDKRMASIGYLEFRSDNPKKAIKHLVSAMKPLALKAQLEEDLEYSRDIGRDWKKFLSHAVETAENIQKELQSLKRAGYVHQENESKPEKQDKNVKKGNRTKKSSQKSEESLKQSDSAEEKKVVCWNDQCKGPHTLKDCKVTSEDRKKEIVAEKRKARAEKSARRLAGDGKEINNSTLFRATFGKGVSRVVCADGGSDINLMPPSVLENLLEENKDLEVTYFKEPRKFGLAAQQSSIKR